MKIQILSMPRTGSSYLKTMLNFQMTKYVNYFTISEPFNDSKQSLIKYQNRNTIINSIKSSDNALVKSHIHELINIQHTDVFKEYSAIDWYTICLLRRNIFTLTLSRVIAISTGVWDNQNFKNLIMHIDFEIFKNYLIQTLNWIRFIKLNSFNFIFHKVVFYEDLLFKSESDLNNIGIPVTHTTYYAPSRLYLKRDIISNYNELYQNTIEFTRGIQDLSFDGVYLQDNIIFNNNSTLNI